jgi:hypothetical protein
MLDVPDLRILKMRIIVGRTEASGLVGAAMH